MNVEEALNEPAPGSGQEGGASVDHGRRAAGGAAAAVFREVVQGLYEGRYVPGQRLVESDLSAAYGVSRSTVREALAQLAAEGIVQLSPHRGAQVHRLTRAEADEILVLLETLTGLAARLAAARTDNAAATARFAASLETLLKFENAGEGEAFQRARNEYFRALVTLTGNARLRRVLRGLNVHLLRVQMRHYQIEGDTERFEDYRAMGEAILSGDPEASEAAGHRYIRRVAGAVAGLPDRVFAAA